MLKMFVNGKIYTVNANRDWAEAVVLDGDKIAYVGDNEGAKTFAEGKEAETVDLAGKMMLPGFIDGHCHPVMGAFFKPNIVLNGLYTLEEIQAEIKRYIDEYPDRDNYCGIGFEESCFGDEGPNREMLDVVCPDKPVMLLGTGGHVGWCNTKALEVAGITRDTVDPLPGSSYFKRDENGDPTGYVLEALAEVMVFEKIDFFDLNSIDQAMLQISDEYASMGVTSLADMGGFPYMVDYMKGNLPKLAEKGALKQRMTLSGMLAGGMRDVDECLNLVLELREKFNDDKLRFNFFKIVNDGTLESHTAALTTLYMDANKKVDPFFTQEELIEACLKVAETGLDINIHNIGDEACRDMVVMAQAVRNAGFSDTRFTNSHSTYIYKGDAPKFGELGILANTTCVWHSGFESSDDMLSDEMPPQYEMKSVLNHGGKVGLGSDFPVDLFGREPLKGIQMGCTREMYADDVYPGTFPLEPASEAMSLDDVISGYTINNAYQVRMEDKLGSIEAGKYADLVILEKNIFDVPIEEVYKVKVCETIMNGKTTYTG